MEMTPLWPTRTTWRKPPGPAPGDGGGAGPVPAWGRSRRTLTWPRWLVLVLLFWAGCAGAQEAAETPDSRAFKAAARDYQIGVYERAEREFAVFVSAYPDSPMLPEAILLQARAALNQTNLPAGIALLRTNLHQAGPLTDQYRYWLADAQFQSRAYAAAAESFAALTRDSTNSPLLLEASHGEALARFRLGDLPQVTALLQQTNGTFQSAARSRPTDVLAVRGFLLLGEALLAQRHFNEAEQVVLDIPERDLTPEFRWARQHLLCRILAMAQRSVEALSATSNLLAVAVATARPGVLADSVELLGELLDQLDRPDAAAAAYTNNLAETVPIEQQRLALLRIIQIKLAQDKIADASSMLDGFLAAHPDDGASGVVLLTLGELQLKRHQLAAVAVRTEASLETATNHLQQASAHIDKFLKTQTNSPLRGRAFFDLGWCLWLDGKVGESAAAFKTATELLPWSEDLAQARFKLGDAQFSEGEFTNAIASYRAVTNDFGKLPRARGMFIDLALFQILRAHVELGDPGAARETMAVLLSEFPQSPLADRGLLRIGQGYLDANDAGKARQTLKELVQRSPDGALRAEAELAVAGSYAAQSAWREALEKYDQWIARFPTNELRPLAEYQLARTTWQSGSETNAFRLFTNFVAAFPTHELAPRAQYWVGDHYLRQGDWEKAQGSFQRILENTNWPVTRLTYQARLAAGHAAFARQGWKEAIGDRGHFMLLINDVRGCPPEIAAEALYAFGDTLTVDPSLQPPQRFRDARVVFEKILPFATNQIAARLIPLAWGRIGDCSLQLASQDGTQYDRATNAYLSAMSHPLADVTTRSRAEFGLAKSLEVQSGGATASDIGALRAAAFEHYYNIAIGSNLRSGEEADLIWVKEAGFAAARLAEEQHQWKVALNLYKHLYDSLAPLRPRLQEKIDRVNEQLQRKKD